MLRILMPLVVLSTLIMSSCKTIVDYNAKGEFKYYNKLSTPVRIDIVGSSLKAHDSRIIAPGDSMVLFTSGMTSEKKADPKGYVPAVSADSTVVYFNDSLCYGEYHRDGAVLHNINSYTTTKRGDLDHIFYFNIDSDLYKLAGKCK